MFKDYNTKSVVWKAYEIKPDDIIAEVEKPTYPCSMSKDCKSSLTTSDGESLVFYHNHTETVRAGDWIMKETIDNYHHEDSKFRQHVTVG